MQTIETIFSFTLRSTTDCCRIFSGLWLGYIQAFWLANFNTEIQNVYHFNFSQNITCKTAMSMTYFQSIYATPMGWLMYGVCPGLFLRWFSCLIQAKFAASSSLPATELSTAILLASNFKSIPNSLLTKEHFLSESLTPLILAFFIFRHELSTTNITVRLSIYCLTIISFGHAKKWEEL